MQVEPEEEFRREIMEAVVRLHVAQEALSERLDYLARELGKIALTLSAPDEKAN